MLVAVPCSGDDSVRLLDAENGAERGVVGVGPHPVHLEALEGRVFVATMGDRAVTVIVDGEARRVETGVLGPSHFATTADGLVLVPCTGGDALAIIDGEGLDLRDRVGVGREPHDVAVFEDRAFVGSRADGTVSVVDPAAARVEAEVDLGADARVQGVTAGPGGVFAVDQRHGRLVKLTGGGVVGEVAVGADPYDATLAGSRVLVPGRGDGTVTEVRLDLGGRADLVDLADMADRTVHDVGGTPTDVAVVEGTAWVADREAAVLRSLDGRTVELPFPAFSLSAHPGEASVVVAAHYDDDAVSAVDVGADGDTSEGRWTTPTPSRPMDPLVI